MKAPPDIPIRFRVVRMASRTLMIAAAIFLLIVFAAAILNPGFLGGRTRSQPARVKADMRSIETAMQEYWVDNSSFPAWSAHLGENEFSPKGPANRSVYEKLPTFTRRAQGGVRTLTSPVAYMMSYPADPFSPDFPEPFCFWSFGKLAILWSPGRDGIYDLTMDNIALACDPTKPAPTELLLNLTYDPSNGTGPESKGDIYRLIDDRPEFLTKDSKSTATLAAP